jgi:ankyrin repeat protein
MSWVVSQNGRTPLMYACDVDGVSEGTCEDLLRVLLNAGATAGVFTQNVMGLDALSLLVTAGRYNLMETLLDVVEPLCADNQPMRFVRCHAR